MDIGGPALSLVLVILAEKVISIPTMDNDGPSCFHLAGRDKRLPLREHACCVVLALDGM